MRPGKQSRLELTVNTIAMRSLAVTVKILSVFLLELSSTEFLSGLSQKGEQDPVLYDISHRSPKHDGFGYSDEKVIYQRIKQVITFKPADQMTLFDLDYSADVLSSRNVVRMELKKKKKKKKKRRSKSSRKIRNANCTESVSDVEHYPYDYDQFRREYFDLNWDRRNDSRMEPGNQKKKLAYNCRPDDWRDGVGPITLYCTLHRGFQQGFNKPMIARLAQLIKFWLIVYLIAGGSLWIICGWCCCCLKCKIFKPEEIRQEIRSYILQNPPGVLKDKMHGEKICYTPMRDEIDAYDELEIKAYAYV